MHLDLMKHALRVAAVLSLGVSAAAASAEMLITAEPLPTENAPLRVTGSAGVVELGESITFTVSADNLSDFFGLSVNLAFDSSKMEFVSISLSAAVPCDEEICVPQFFEDELAFVFSSSAILNEDYDLFDVVFRTIAPGRADFSVSGIYERSNSFPVGIDGHSDVLVNGTVQTPEPGALAMMLVGAGLLAAGRRLRRRTA